MAIDPAPPEPDILALADAFTYEPSASDRCRLPKPEPVGLVGRLLAAAARSTVVPPGAPPDRPPARAITLREELSAWHAAVDPAITASGLLFGEIARGLKLGPPDWPTLRAVLHHIGWRCGYAHAARGGRPNADGHCPDVWYEVWYQPQDVDLRTGAPAGLHDGIREAPARAPWTPRVIPGSAA